MLQTKTLKSELRFKGFNICVELYLRLECEVGLEAEHDGAVFEVANLADPANVLDDEAMCLAHVCGQITREGKGIRLGASLSELVLRLRTSGTKRIHTAQLRAWAYRTGWGSDRC